MTKRDEYLKLVREIQRHDYCYYIEARPLISDYEYDLLYKELQKMEKEHPDWVLPYSPSQRIGDPLTQGFRQVAHETPMLSLENTYSAAEIQAFVKRVYKLLGSSKVSFATELKMDGVAVSLLYEGGVYKRALTRGDGKKGDEITNNMKTLPYLPLKLMGKEIPERLEIRGEVFMSHRVFNRQNAQREKRGEELWANPRNAAAGSLKLLDPKEFSKRELSAIFYGIASDSPSVLYQHEIPTYLKKVGLPTFSKEDRGLCHSMEEILSFSHHIEKRKARLDFDIDGIVIKVDTLKSWSLLGTTRKAPRWAVAYKFSPKQTKAHVREIVVQVGRSGVLTPVAELDPVLLAGSTISRATLHNEEEVRRKDIRKGDWVVIEKGGDVIPQIVEVELNKRSPHSKPWRMPTRCPCCQTPVTRTEDRVAVRCPNEEGCQEQKIRRLIHFASKQGMNIENLGDKIAEQLVTKNLVDTPSDLYSLTEKELAQVKGFKEKSIRNLLENIETSRKASLSRFILALGIRYVGEETADILSDHLNSIEALAAISKEELLKMEGVGEKIADAICFYFKQPRHLKEIKKLLNRGVQPNAVKRMAKSSHPFFNKKFVLTGTLSHFSREEASHLIKERGGKVLHAISRHIDYVLVGDKAGSKLSKAKKLHLSILEEEKFKKML